MPYMAINTSKLLSDAQKYALKTAPGNKIALIPGKGESKLTVDISDGHAVYFAGEKRELVYADVKCSGATEFANKKAFTEAVFEVVQRVTGLPQNGIYLTYGEFENWGAMGSLE